MLREAAQDTHSEASEHYSRLAQDIESGEDFSWQLCWIIGRGAFHKFSNVVNPTSYGGTALTFDPEDRLTAFGSAQTDRYDGDGHRAAKNIGSTYYYLYDGDQVLATGQPTGALGGLNTWGADGLVSTRSATYSVYDTFDERGGLAQRLSAAGGVYTTDKYDAFGSRTSTAIPSDGWGFGAQWGYFTDKETGLVLCGHRFYDPGTGRWLTRDPIRYNGGVNLYGYCQNDPINRVDPVGWWTFTITVGVVVAIPVIGPIGIGGGADGGVIISNNGWGFTGDGFVGISAGAGGAIGLSGGGSSATPPVGRSGGPIFGGAGFAGDGPGGSVGIWGSPGGGPSISGGRGGPGAAIGGGGVFGGGYSGTIIFPWSPPHSNGYGSCPDDSYSSGGGAAGNPTLDIFPH